MDFGRHRLKPLEEELCPSASSHVDAPPSSSSLPDPGPQTRSSWRPPEIASLLIATLYCVLYVVGQSLQSVFVPVSVLWSLFALYTLTIMGNYVLWDGEQHSPVLCQCSATILRYLTCGARANVDVRIVRILLCTTRLWLLVAFVSLHTAVDLYSPDTECTTVNSCFFTVSMLYLLTTDLHKIVPTRPFRLLVSCACAAVILCDIVLVSFVTPDTLLFACNFTLPIDHAPHTLAIYKNHVKRIALTNLFVLSFSAVRTLSADRHQRFLCVPQTFRLRASLTSCPATSRAPPSRRHRRVEAFAALLSVVTVAVWLISALPPASFPQPLDHSLVAIAFDLSALASTAAVVALFWANVDRAILAKLLTSWYAIVSTVSTFAVLPLARLRGANGASVLAFSLLSLSFVLADALKACSGRFLLFFSALYATVVAGNLVTSVYPLSHAGNWPADEPPLFTLGVQGFTGSQLEQAAYVQLLVASTSAVLCIWRDAWRGQPRESLAFVRANVPRPLLSMRSGILRGPLLRTGAARVPAVARTPLIVSMSSEDGLRASEADLTIVAQV